MVDVLIADTDELYQKAMGKMIDDCEGCRLIGTASTGKEAMELANSFHPQVILADVSLKRESGINVCRKLRNRLPDSSIYILTSYEDYSLLHGAMEAGVNEYLFKPISRKKLVSIIEDSRRDSPGVVEDLNIEKLITSLDDRNYKASYDVAKEVVGYLFRECSKEVRKQKMIDLGTSLFYIIPGMDSAQKEYYLQKYKVNSKNVNKPLLCFCWIMQIVTEVYRQLCTMKYSHMNKVFQFIEDNKNNEIALADLSAQAGISSGYLSRIFKKYYKISVVDYIHLRKISMAKYYMATSEMNISDISFLLGYSEAGYFCKIFKKYEGRTPSSFNRYSKELRKAAL